MCFHHESIIITYNQRFLFSSWTGGQQRWKGQLSKSVDKQTLHSGWELPYQPLKPPARPSVRPVSVCSHAFVFSNLINDFLKRQFRPFSWGFYCCIVFVWFCSMEERTLGLTQARQVLNHLATSLATSLATFLAISFVFCVCSHEYACVCMPQNTWMWKSVVFV